LARPFPAIGGAIQGGKRGKSKRKEWGLIPPNQFGKNGWIRGGFGGGNGARVHGRERKEAGGWRLGARLTGGTHAGGALNARAAHVRARLGQEGAAAWAGLLGRGRPGGRRRREWAAGRKERKTKGGERDLDCGPRGREGDFGPDLAQREEGDYF
jgi:hypothetical protein